MPIKSVSLGIDWKTIEKKVEEEREKGGGFFLFKKKPEKVSYLSLVAFPSVHIEYEHQKNMNKTSVMETSQAIIEPWLGKGRMNIPNKAAATQVEYQGFSHLQNGYYIPWQNLERGPKVFAEHFVKSTRKLGSNIEGLEVKNVCYLPRFIAKLEKKEGEFRYLVYNFQGDHIEMLSERMTNDPYYRQQVEGNMMRIP
ncbi:MAG: hypothetical protein ACLFVL_07455 [Candidatus Aenigmatarchaeota archaeon]